MVILFFVILKRERSVIIPTLKADMKERKKNTAGFAVGIPGGCIGIPDVPVDPLPLKTFFFFYLFLSRPSLHSLCPC